MRGFVVFEVAPPFQWKPKYERDKTVKRGKFHRFIWLWFSITFVFGLKWTDFINVLMTSQPPEGQPISVAGHDEHEDNLGIG